MEFKDNFPTKLGSKQVNQENLLKDQPTIHCYSFGLVHPLNSSFATKGKENILFCFDVLMFLLVLIDFNFVLLQLVVF